MDDMEKLLDGLRCRCAYFPERDCARCHYGIQMGRRWGCDFRRMTEDALALLKAQTPRLLTAWDFLDNPDADAGGAIPCWKESKSPTRRSGWAVICYGKWLGDTEGGTCRYWTGKPTEEQREATPW